MLKYSLLFHIKGLKAKSQIIVNEAIKQSSVLFLLQRKLEHYTKNGSFFNF